MIRMLLASMLAALFAVSSAAADTQDVYTISDLEVDEVAPTLIQAREQCNRTASRQSSKFLGIESIAPPPHEMDEMIRWSTLSVERLITHPQLQRQPRPRSP